MDKGVRSFFTWQQISCLVMAYILRLESLREVEAVLGVPRATLSDANANRNCGFFQELCEMILFEIRNRTKSRKIRKAIKNLLALDASECRVHGSLFSEPLWRKGKKKWKNATVRFHAIWNVNGEWIEDFRITPGKVMDSPVSKLFKIKKGFTYICDRAYKDLSFWWNIMDGGSHIVSRLTGCTRYHYHELIVLKDCKDQDGVLWDGEWVPSKQQLRQHPEVSKDIKLRWIIYRDPETKKIFHFITSHMDVDAQAIADTYKRRWAVELLFRWLKGHLNIRYFALKNKNAIKVQLTTAVLVQLLIQLYRISTKFNGTLWECLRDIRTQLTINGLANSGFPDLKLPKPLSHGRLTV